MVNLGPLKPITGAAFRALDRIASILAKAPKDEWLFILKFAKEKAEDLMREKDKNRK